MIILNISVNTVYFDRCKGSKQLTASAFLGQSFNCFFCSDLKMKAGGGEETGPHASLLCTSSAAQGGSQKKPKKEMVSLELHSGNIIACVSVSNDTPPFTCNFLTCLLYF